MTGFRFSEFIDQPRTKDLFGGLLELFRELLVYTSGDMDEALSWLTELDKEYDLTNEEYGIADFIKDLKKKGFIEDEHRSGRMRITAKMEQSIRQQSLEEIFGKLKKSKRGSHRTGFSGDGDETTADRKPFEFGDRMDRIALTDSIRNAQINHGIGDFRLTENDLEIQETQFNTRTSTVLMIDISHSMILYGEDRITPAKKTAMGLAELITRKYPKDSLDVIVFGNDAWPVKIKDLPYLKVGPFHTNTVAGLELAMDILRRKRNNNKQIFMITDGKPTCIKKGKHYYKNSFGLDRRIVQRTLTLARQCRKQEIDITTFMIATDPYLQQFVEQFTRANRGKAYFSSLRGLGEYIFEDYAKNKRKRLR